MKKELPKPKKSIKSFILDEDAKVIDKTAVKVAVTGSFLALNFALNADDANAQGHKNHTNHENHLRQSDVVDGSDQMPGGDEVKYETELSNEGDEQVTYTDSFDDYTIKVDVPPKSVAAAHGNHYNHVDGGGQGA